jgi:hypothetical protein
VADRIGSFEEMVIAVGMCAGRVVGVYLAGMVVVIAAEIDWLDAGYHQVQALDSGC